jgi:hypothetical protein
VGNGTDLDDNSQTVMRYNVWDNAGLSSHGADTSFVGMRRFEFYNNAGVFTGYTDGTTANMSSGWMFIRGGTWVWFNNVLPVITSQDFGTQADLKPTVMSLRREDNFACWGSGFTTGGQYYHAPRQIGFGFVTGSGTVTFPPTYSSSSTAPPSQPVYVGDSEPAYIWGNTRTAGGATVNMNVGLLDYFATDSTMCPSSPALDTTANYFVSGRDYFNNGTAKPGYTPFTYPHPLAAAPSVSLSPLSLIFASQTVGTTSSAQTVTLSNTGSATTTGIAISFTGANPGDFTETTSCGTTLAGSASCQIFVTFTPAAVGTRTATLSVSDSGAGSPQTSSLSGTAIPSVINPSPANPVTFGVVVTDPSITSARAKLLNAPGRQERPGPNDPGLFCFGLV